jgi:hypothetical protein
MVTRERLYELVDALPEAELSAAARYLEQLRERYEHDPLIRLLDEAPEDDEPLTPEEEAEIEESWQEYLRGKTRPWEAVRAELPDE